MNILELTNNMSGLDWGSQYDQLVLAEELLENEYSPTHYASCIKVIKLLLEDDSPIDIQDECTRVLLQYTLNDQRCNIKILRFLLKNGVNSKNRWGHIESEYNPKGKQIYKQYENMYALREWRPWNHDKYPESYRLAVKTLVLLSKSG